MRAFLLAAMLTVFAAPAVAATIWVAPTAATDSTGADSTHAHSLAWANANAVGGDARWPTLDLRPSKYSALYNSAAPGGHYGALAKP